MTGMDKRKPPFRILFLNNVPNGAYLDKNSKILCFECTHSPVTPQSNAHVNTKRHSPKCNWVISTSMILLHRISCI